MRTNVYVDGFNLYYGCLKDTPYKWLNILALCTQRFPKNKIQRIRYFTAHVQPTKTDPLVASRQLTYLRALQTIPNLTIHLGKFKQRTVKRQLAYPSKGLPKTVWVVDIEEKESDVNLATYLLRDGYEGDFEAAIVISNDSDLREPIRVVKERLNKPIGIFNPQRDPNKESIELMEIASFRGRIGVNLLKSSQFPATLEDAKGTIHKPSDW